MCCISKTKVKNKNLYLTVYNIMYTCKIKLKKLMQFFAVSKLNSCMIHSVCMLLSPRFWLSLNVINKPSSCTTDDVLIHL